MLRHRRCVGGKYERTEEKRITLTSKHPPNRRSVRGCLPKTHSDRQPAPSPEEKFFDARAFNREGKLHRKTEVFDVSSTESTNLSELEKISNVLALKKEINEWKHQEALRARVNEILERARNTTDKNEINEAEDKSTQLSKVCEIQSNKRCKTPETIDDTRQVDSSRCLSTSRKREEERMPEVTWITMQPGTSSRTTVKSAADYLTESEDEVDRPKSHMCLSLEFLNALDNAEKLVEEAERQLSGIKSNAFAIDDSATEEFVNKTNYERPNCNQNARASMVEKCIHNRRAGMIHRRDNLKTKVTLNKASKLKLLEIASKAPKKLPESPKLIQKLAAESISAPKQVNPEVPPDERLVCKSSQTELVTEIPEVAKTLDHANVENTAVQQEVHKSKPEKLHVQKGPVISIKGDFSIQTAKIIDIQPNELVYQMSKERCDNIATYEICHTSNLKETSLHDEQSKFEKSENDIARHAPANVNMPRDTRQNEFPTGQCEHQAIYESVPEKQTHSLTFAGNADGEDCIIYRKEQYSEGGIGSWKVQKDVSLDSIDFEDLSLKEPPILTDIDLILDQQRRIIQRVHSVNKKFDKFLVHSLPNEASVISEDNEISNKSYSIKERKEEENIQMANDRKCTNLPNKADCIANKSSSVNSGQDTSSSTSSKSEKCKENKSKSENVEEADKISSNSKQFNKLLTISNTDLILNKDVSSTETKQHSHYSEKSSVRSRTIHDFDSLLSQQLSIKGQKSETNKECSLKYDSPDQAISHSDTKSNAGFIENLKNSQSLKDNNLEIKMNRDGKTNISQVLKSKDDKIHKFQANIDADTEKLKRNELIIQLDVENEKGEAHLKKNIVECKDNIGPEEVQDHLEENSDKTSHLIESISDISINKIHEDVQDSLGLFSVSNFKENDRVFQTKLATPVLTESSDKKATEFKIEHKLSETRDSLNSLLRSMNSNDENIKRGSLNIEQPSEQLKNKKSLGEYSGETSTESKNAPAPKINFDQHMTNREVLPSETTFQANQEYKPTNSTSLVTMLEENGNIVLETIQQKRLRLLKKLESCSIPPNYDGKRFFTSTVLGDAIAPNTFARSKGSSESSLDVHSEGEVCLSSSASYSLGEIRKNTECSKSTSSTKGASSNSSNAASLLLSTGEVVKTESNSTR